MLKQFALVLMSTSIAFVFGNTCDAASQPGVVLPALESGWNRLFISAGTASGPVVIDGQDVGHATSDEYFVVDLLPGTYAVTCTPDHLNGNFTEKRDLTFKVGETRAFACDRAPYGGGWAAVVPFGAIGGAVVAAASTSSTSPKYSFKTHLVERPSIVRLRKVVAYSKLKQAEQSAPQSGE